MRDDFDVEDVVDEVYVPPDAVEDINIAAENFIRVRGRVDKLTKEKLTLRNDLMDLLSKYGSDMDGHLVYQLPESIMGNSVLMRQHRVSKKLNEKRAEKILKSKNIYEICTKQVQVLDEDAILAALYEGKLEDEDIEAMFPSKETYALVVKK